MKIKPILFYLLLISPFGLVKAQDTLSFSLAQAQEYAVKNNYQVKAAALDLETAKSKIKETTAIGLPQASGSIAYQNIFDVPTMNLGPSFYVAPDQAGKPINVGADLYQFYHASDGIALGVKENLTYTFTATQLVFSGEYLVGLQAMKAFKEMSEKGLAKSERDVKESVSKSYYMALVAENSLEVLKQSYAIMQKTYQDIKGLNAQGLTEETDVDQLYITMTTLENTINNATNQRDLTYRLLKFQLGINASDNIKLSDKLENIFASNAIILVDSTNFNFQNNIDYLLVKQNIEIQRLSLKREQSKFLPSIAAVYRFQKLQKEPSFNFTPKNVLALQLDVPIFSSGMRMTRTKQAKIALEKSEITAKQVQEGLELEYQQTVSEYKNAFSTYTLQTENLNLSKKIFDRTIIKFKNGLATSMEINTAQSQYLANMGQYYGAVINMVNARYKIEKLKN